MTIQLSVAVRNARLDSLETTVGLTPQLAIFSGAVPVNCAPADPAGELARMTLPADWMAAASGGSKALAGTWTTTASGAWTALSFRIYASDGTTCHLQGTVGLGSGDLSLDNTSIAVGPTATVTSLSPTAEVS